MCRYELPGGFIKNAWLTALSLAVARDGTECTVTQADLHAGASHQLRGRLAMSNFDRGIVPQRGLEEVELPPSIKEKLKRMVNYSKAQVALVPHSLRNNSHRGCEPHVFIRRRRCCSASGASSGSTGVHRASRRSSTVKWRSLP